MVAQPPAAPPGQPTISQDDRALAGLSHFTCFLGFPVIAPIAIYAFKKDTSRFVAFHALQAAITHFSLLPLLVVGYVLSFVITVGGGLAFGEHAPVLAFGMVAFWWLATLVPCVLVAGISLYAGVKGFGGEGYRIPIAASIAQRIMAPPSPTPAGF